MSKNKMSEVAKLLGVKLDEEFEIESFRCNFKLTNNGLMHWSYLDSKWLFSNFFAELLTGELKIIKIPKPILDDKEKEYLSAVIKPFRDQIIAIAKRSANYGEFIDIMIDEGDIGDCGNIYLPYFKPNSMYKGMKVNREYTLDQLGL